MKKIPLSVILMVHNEEETIANEVKSYYQEIVKKIPGSEMVIVDDGNIDETGNILHKLKKHYPLTLLTSSRKIGYARSLRWSMEEAKGELVFYADAAGKHDSKDFWKLYRHIGDFDLVTGFKKKRHDPWYRLFLAWGLNFIVNFYFGVKFSDIDCGFKLINKKAKKVLLSKDWLLKNNISLEIVLRAIAEGLKTREVPIKHFARSYGESRGLPLIKIPKAVLNILKSLPMLKRELFSQKGYL